jgi:secreted trypsin-like serine protease
MFTALLLSACGFWSTPELELTDEPGPLTQGHAMIFGGDAPDSPEHDAVVGLHEVYPGGLVSYPFCSGTLIDDDIVLTAAHCLEDYGGGTVDPSSIVVYFGDDPSVDLLGHHYDVDEVQIHADYDSIRITDDIGIIRLAEDAATAEGVAPVPNLPASEAIDTDDIGTIMNLAGFGYTESWDYGTKLQVDVELAGMGCAVFGCAGADDEDTQISYDQSGGEGICSGDSGGPVFFERDGTVYVAGAHSYTDYWCEMYGVSTKVDAYEDWIADFIDGTGSGGGPGGGGASCGDGTCDPGESCDGRGPTDLCPEDCDGRTFGPPRIQYCYVNGYCEGRGCLGL